MRGLMLLFLLGLVVAVMSTRWPPGSRSPLRDDVLNVTEVTEYVWFPLENTGGFPPEENATVLEEALNTTSSNTTLPQQPTDKPVTEDTEN
ncbi:hypothetical protein JOB18_002839 [Solea senegalensis]|uniref:Uncharacterized protein n=1 Tax=Solea senegalensis TaxID=28829 RepID=A0AAV6T305_SOLSE|nr:hypothetical protein JOB18_002839 [Solea senegalensis]